MIGEPLSATYHGGIVTVYLSGVAYWSRDIRISVRYTVIYGWKPDDCTNCCVGFADLMLVLCLRWCSIAGRARHISTDYWVNLHLTIDKYMIPSYPSHDRLAMVMPRHARSAGASLSCFAWAVYRIGDCTLDATSVYTKPVWVKSGKIPKDPHKATRGSLQQHWARTYA